MDDISGYTTADIARFLEDEAAAQDALQKLRWPHGVICPNPGCKAGGERIYELNYIYRDSRSGEIKPTFRKRWKCGACRKKFSVTSHSVLKGSHIPAGKWLYAIHLLWSSRRAVTAEELSAAIQVSCNCASFMCRRLRRALKQEYRRESLGTPPEEFVNLESGLEKAGETSRNASANASGSKDALVAAVAQIVSSYVGYNSVAAGEVPRLIQLVHGALASAVAARQWEQARLSPAAFPFSVHL